jgi:hypothetical protein
VGINKLRIPDEKKKEGDIGDEESGEWLLGAYCQPPIAISSSDLRRELAAPKPGFSACTPCPQARH